MNKKVYISMLVLTISFLVGLYVLKIFFPNVFIINIQNGNIVLIGNYIDNHKWAYYSLGAITSFATYFLYLCAVCKKWCLNLKECLIVFVTILISICLSFINIQIVTIFSYVSFIILPFFLNSNLKEVAIVFSTHISAQYLSLTIRSLPLYLVDVNSLIMNIIGFESYFWLLLFYIIFNYKNKMEV